MTALDRITARITAQQSAQPQQATSATYLGVQGGYARVRTEDQGVVQVPIKNITTDGALRVGQQVQLTRPLHGQPFINAQVR